MLIDDGAIKQSIAHLAVPEAPDDMSLPSCSEPSRRNPWTAWPWPLLRATAAALLGRDGGKRSAGVEPRKWRGRCGGAARPSRAAWRLRCIGSAV